MEHGIICLARNQNQMLVKYVRQYIYVFHRIYFFQFLQGSERVFNEEEI